MRRDFLLTRSVLTLSVLGLVSWGVAERLDHAAGTAPDLPVLEPPPYDPYLPSWEDELSSPEIQAVWQERRLLLADLSRRFRAEIDSARAADLRREMEQVIARAERDIMALRLARARGAGHEAQAARLAEALARLGPPESVIER